MTARLASGRTALTQYRVLERFGNFTLLEVRIGTGRTHQIRVHLASIGHPIAGDRLYGAPAEVPELANLDRYLLHSHRLIFRSPSSGHLITVEAPLPADFAAWLDALRAMQRTGNPDL
jgi:23S rRNA pseudouridine1911/1915/1917 synthase